MLGWQFRISQNDIDPAFNAAFIGIAVALLGRNTAVGTFFAALLFGKFCLGAYVYHLLRGNVALANGTCPWSDSA